jgi:hypothetical protein
MRILIFTPEFEAAIRAGVKNMTIRPVPRRPLQAGDDLSLRAWSGRPYRSKQRVLGDVPCVAVLPVRLARDDVTLAGRALRHIEVMRFAWNDGFWSVGGMLDWFDALHGLPFAGVAICWRVNPWVDLAAEKAEHRKANNVQVATASHTAPGRG